ncbi:hypothetical protein PHET_09437 [Paragonimus heterotremus]|uniref:Uncharacterized protein n=1 Tax=Paragonimus heterotremus TaxID=100268 RepID=A0A8J4SLW3_9TREM|nr:hypothetical protein PHET_09437 [Paragonimus heterotremus]
MKFDYGPNLDPFVRRCRFKFSKLLMSTTLTKRYLDERWLPQRIEALTELNDLAWKVAQQFPDVFLDKIGTREWKSVDSILLLLNTALSLCMREHFRDATQCEEEDLLEFARLTSTQSVPSQMF